VNDVLWNALFPQYFGGVLKKKEARPFSLTAFWFLCHFHCAHEPTILYFMKYFEKKMHFYSQVSRIGATKPEIRKRLEINGPLAGFGGRSRAEAALRI
jgi:hypothetical protein